jgi:hypothetical protein
VAGRRPTARALIALLACAPLALSACGGGDDQSANEATGTYEVDIVRASFAERQNVAKQEEFTIAVRNTGDETLPNLSVTVDSFSQRSEATNLSDSSRPFWVVDDIPRGGTTAYVNTWALGRLPAGATREFTWKVSPVAPGQHRVRYRVNAGLDGKAKAVLAGGVAPEGTIDVRIATEPPVSRVDPETGEVVREGE